MFANSVISCSSISIFSLLLSRLLPPFLSLTFCLQSFLLVYVLPTRFFLSRLVLREQRVQSTSKSSSLYVVASHPASPRSFSLFLSVFFSPSLLLRRDRASVLPSLLPPRLSFILPCGSNVSVSSTLLHRPVRRIRVIDLNVSFSLSFYLIRQFVLSKRATISEPLIFSLSSRLFSRMNSAISG